MYESGEAVNAIMGKLYNDLALCILSIKDINQIFLNQQVLAVALLNLEVCYRIPNLCARGHVWYTNTQCTTSFRGYGIPQASTFMENIIHDIAQTLDLPQEQVGALFYLDSA